MRHYTVITLVVLFLVFPITVWPAERELLEPGLSKNEPLVALVHAKGTACHNSLLRHFIHPAITVLHLTPDGSMVIKVKLKHESLDIPHMARHIIQFYRAVANSGFIAHYNDAHNTGAGHFIEEQANESARAFRLIHGGVCD